MFPNFQFVGSRIGFGVSRVEGLLGFLAVVGGFVENASAEEIKLSPVPPLFRQLAPLPAIVQAARSAHMDLTGLVPAMTRAGLRSGDGVTALVSLTDGADVRQWVVAVTAVQPNAQEKKAKARTARFFSSSGYEFRFGSGLAALELKLFGPLRATDDPRKAAAAPDVRQRRVTVSSDFLGLGLDRVPAMMLRVRAARRANPELREGEFALGSEPFPSARAAQARKEEEALGVTESDERAVAGSVLALLEFFQITSNTPGLREVLLGVIDVPWWSIIASGGKAPEVGIEMLPPDRPLNATVWGFSRATRIFSYPFVLTLNGKPTLLCQLAVTSPQPPLLASAGIVGLAAGRPDGTGPVLTLQVVSSRLAPAAEKLSP